MFNIFKSKGEKNEFRGQEDYSYLGDRAWNDNRENKQEKNEQEKKEIGSTAKIIIAGPPHSGKSVAENYLRNLLPPMETNKIAAQPDGEGDWTHKIYSSIGELDKILGTIDNLENFLQESEKIELSEKIQSKINELINILKSENVSVEKQLKNENDSVNDEVQNKNNEIAKNLLYTNQELEGMLDSIITNLSLPSGSDKEALLKLLNNKKFKVARQLQSKADELKKLRKKGEFSQKLVDFWKEQIENSTSRFNLIDVGGLITDENNQLCESANAMIIISSDPKKTKEWVDLAKKNGLNILAVLQSKLSINDPNAYEELSVAENKDWETEGTVVDLDRHKNNNHPALIDLEKYLLKRVSKQEEKEYIGDYKILSIESIAEMVGKDTTQRIEWDAEDLPNVYKTVQEIVNNIKNESNQDTKEISKFVIDGRAPQFLIINILNALKPSQVGVGDPKVDERERSMVEISGKNYPKGEGSGPLPWTVTEDFEEGTLVEYAKNVFVTLKKEDISEIIPPQIDVDTPVFLSGRTANWAAAEIALSYASYVPAVYLYYPNVGYICVASNSEEHNLGKVVASEQPVVSEV